MYKSIAISEWEAAKTTRNYHVKVRTEVVACRKHHPRTRNHTRRSQSTTWGDCTPVESKLRSRKERENKPQSGDKEVGLSKEISRKPPKKMKMVCHKGKAGFFTSSLRPPGTVFKRRGHSRSVVSMRHSNALPFLDLSLKLRVALFEVADMIELSLPRFTSRKSIACSLQGNLVGGVDCDVGQRTFATTRLADAVCGG